MIPPILNPEPQFCDADGNPYAGGTIETYARGTSTPKTVWVDPDQTAAQTNPIVLNAAGRCTWYGSGEYRLILRDAAGNQVWDQDSTTIVSAAMAPVIAAPTIPDAVHALGIDELIDAEALARSNADSAEQNARIAADNAEATARAAADTTLQTNIDAEVARATAAEAHLQTEIDGLAPGGGTVLVIQSGSATIPLAAVAGTLHVTFPTPFATAATAMVCTCSDTPGAYAAGPAAPTFTVRNLAPTGADVHGFPFDAGTGLALPITFYWIAIGS